MGQISEMKNKDIFSKKNILHEAAVAYETRRDSKLFAAPSNNYVSRSLALMGLPSKETGVYNKADFIKLIRNGIPKIVLDNIISVTDIPAIEMAGIIHTTDRTLRRYTNDQLLNPEQTERIIELATLYARGEEVFEGIDNFKLWMNTPVMALGNKKPKEFLDTSIGIELLFSELGRIEHGVFA